MLELVLVWAICAGFTMAIAASKHRDQLWWLVLGVVFGPVAFLAVGLMPAVDRKADAPTPDTHVKCPDCRELVIKDARVCKHCGCRLVPQDQVQPAGG